MIGILVLIFLVCLYHLTFVRDGEDPKMDLKAWLCIPVMIGCVIGIIKLVERLL